MNFLLWIIWIIKFDRCHFGPTWIAASSTGAKNSKETVASLRRLSQFRPIKTKGIFLCEWTSGGGGDWGLSWIWVCADRKHIVSFSTVGEPGPIFSNASLYLVATEQDKKQLPPLWCEWTAVVGEVCGDSVVRCVVIVAPTLRGCEV